MESAGAVDGTRSGVAGEERGVWDDARDAWGARCVALFHELDPCLLYILFVFRDFVSAIADSV